MLDSATAPGVQRPAPVRIAIVDLYDNLPNEGMRAIGELLSAADGRYFDVPLEVQRFETRFKAETPDLSHDIYLSTGGPGSPFDGEGKAWERDYFRWVDSVHAHNERQSGSPKLVLFICHSFQMMVRHFRVASVIPRRSESFGVFPVFPTPEGRKDPLFEGLADPFFAADFRNWQVVKPRARKIRQLGATILAYEKKRPRIPLERAVMGMRITPEMVGTQFHPEADPPGMSRHFRSDERREAVIKRVGAEKYERIIHRLEEPSFLKRTHDAIIPGFLRDSIARLRPEAVAQKDNAQRALEVDAA